MVTKELSELPCITQYELDAIKNQDSIIDFPQWIHNLGRTLLLFFHALCQNRARLRSRLRELMPEFGILEQKAEQFDRYIATKHKINEPPMIFTRYVMDYTIMSMNMYLTLGFELELYHHTEYLAAYWYLDYIVGYQIQNMNFLYSSKTKKKVKKRSIKLQEQIAVKTQFLEIQDLLARGLYRFIAGLIKSKKYKMNQFRFSSPKARFENRFSSFYTVPQPMPVDYSAYAKFADFSMLPTKDLMSSATEHFRAAKVSIDKTLSTLQKNLTPQQRDELNALLKVCCGS